MDKKKNKMYGMALLCVCLLLSGCSQSAAMDENAMVKDEKGEEFVGEVIQNKVETGKDMVMSYTGQAYSLSELRDAVSLTVKDAYWPNEILDEKTIEEMIGIRPEQYDECLAEFHHVKDNVDQMILVKCREKEITNVEMLMEDYRAWMISSHQGQNINSAKAEASRMEIIADYICFVQLGGDLLHLENDREAMISYCQEQNEKAIDILEKMIFSRI